MLRSDTDSIETFLGIYWAPPFDEDDIVDSAEVDREGARVDAVDGKEFIAEKEGWEETEDSDSECGSVIVPDAYGVPGILWTCY